MRTFLAAIVLSCALAACGGGGGPSATPAISAGGPLQAGGVARVTFVVPSAPMTIAAVGTATRIVSSASTNFSVFVDGAAMLHNVRLAAGSTTDASGAGATIATNADGSLAVSVTFASSTNAHDVRVVTQDDTGATVASAESSATGGTTSAFALGSTIASGYIACATDAQAASGATCGNYANFDAATGAYTFTAVAADAAGYPIVQPAAGVSGAFANGPYNVVEAAADGAPLVTIASSAWTTPGAALHGAAGAFGNAFTVHCVRVGIAHLMLVRVASTPAVPIPAAGGAPGVSVNCDASGSIVII